MKSRLTALIIFGIAFGFVEAAVVFYLRIILGYKLGYTFGNFQSLFNLGFINFIKTQTPILGTAEIARTEIIREAATILMLGSVAFVSAKKMKARIGAFLITFALWDLFYYVFLRLLTGWPVTLMDTDIYFLIPVAWIGPVITPVIISIVLLIAGIKLYSDSS